MAVTLGNQNITSSTGNLGIGTDSPDTKLSINHSVGIAGTGNDTYGQVDLVNLQTGTDGEQIGPFITFRGRRGAIDSTIASYGAIGGVNTGGAGSSQGALTFLVKNSSGAFTDLVEQMRITTGGDLRFKSGYGSVATAYGCRAWVNFNGTLSSNNIRGSGNVSGVTRLGVGNYRVNFATAMPDGNYCATVSSARDTNAVGWSGIRDVNRSTTSIGIGTAATSSLSGGLFSTEPLDHLSIDVSIFR